MSTFVANFTGPILEVAAHPLIGASRDSHIEVDPCDQVLRHRKAYEVDEDGLFTQAEDEPTRTVKRCLRPHEDVEQISRRLAKLSLNTVVGRKRVEGKAVKLRKRFVESVRYTPAQTNSIESAHFAFTFVPKPFTQRRAALPVPMEDIKASMSALDVELVGQTMQVIVSQQRHQVPMVLENLQGVDPEGSREPSASVSIVDTEMEVASERVLALDAAATSPEDEDMLAAELDLALPVARADIKSFIPRFLARTTAAVPRHALSGAVRGTGKSANRKTSSEVPYTRTRRSGGLAPTPRAGGSLMIPENMFDRLVATDEEAPADVEMPSTPVGESVRTTMAVLRLVQPLIAIEDEDIVIASAEDAVRDVRAEIRAGSPTAIVVMDCSTSQVNVVDVVEVFYDAFEEVVDEVMYTEEDVFYSLPPSPSPSFCDLSAYSSDTDEYSVESEPYSPIGTPSMWRFRESRVLPDLEDDEVAVVAVEEMLETEIVPGAADPRFGSLVSRLDKWSCEDGPCMRPATSDVLMSFESEVWYDAMDVFVSPAASLGDISMASVSPSTDDILDTAAQPSASLPPSGSISDFLVDLGRAIRSHPLAGTRDVDIPTLLGTLETPLFLDPAAGARTFRDIYIPGIECSLESFCRDVLSWTDDDDTADADAEAYYTEDDLALSALAEAPRNALNNPALPRIW